MYEVERRMDAVENVLLFLSFSFFLFWTLLVGG